MARKSKNVCQYLGLPQLLYPGLHLLIQGLDAIMHEVTTVHAFHHEVLFSALTELPLSLIQPPVQTMWLSA